MAPSLTAVTPGMLVVEPNIEEPHSGQNNEDTVPPLSAR